MLEQHKGCTQPENNKEITHIEKWMQEWQINPKRVNQKPDLFWYY